MTVASVYGSLDGLITSFVTLTGAEGGGISDKRATALAVGTLIAGGISMSVARYLSSTGGKRESLKAAGITFFWFVAMGSLPVLAHVLSGGSILWTSLMALIVLFGVGIRQGIRTQKNPVKDALRVSFFGVVAAMVAFAITRSISSL